MSYCNIQGEVVIVGCNQKEEKDMAYMSSVKIHMRQGIIYCLFHTRSKSNLMSVELAENIVLETQHHTQPYLMCWIRQDVDLNVKR